MSHNIIRSDQEINRVLNWAAEAVESGESKYPGMTYEQGVIAMSEWLTGDYDEAPDVA